MTVWSVVAWSLVASSAFASSACVRATDDDASAQGRPPIDIAAPVLSTPTMPHPQRARGDAMVKRNADCVVCHEREGDEWSRSRHRQSATNAAYRRALAIEPSPFCRSCHAPEGDPSDPSPTVAALGVGCVTCHVTEGGDVLAAEAGRGPASGAPHALVRSAEFGRPSACAGCHEFRFPMPSSEQEDDDHYMQTTVREHARGPDAATPCPSCHMPEDGGRRSHDFGQVRDPAWLKRSLSVSAAPVDGGVDVTLQPLAVGHGFPTGDLFRRLEIGCDVVDPRGRVLARASQHLARHFQVVAGEQRRVLVRDDRVFDAPRTITLTPPATPAPKGSRVRWWVTLQRVATPGAGIDESTVEIESQTRIFEGSVAWTAPFPERRNETRP